MLRILMTLALCVVCGLSTLDGRLAAGVADNGNSFDPALLAGLRWRSIGPAVTGGRIVDFAIPERSRGRTIYAASASGGLWKTVNAGTTWEPVFDRESAISIGAVALAPSNPDIVWVGTGEANNQRSSSWGDGLYKSVNGGKTWTHVGLRASQHIGRIVIHPDNPDIVYVAAAGPLWGAGKERGLFKTIDGGRTWTNTKFISEHTGFVDAAMDPSDPDRVYALGTNLLVSDDGAKTFRNGLLYVGTDDGVLQVSRDGGVTWSRHERFPGVPDETYLSRVIASRHQERLVYATFDGHRSNDFKPYVLKSTDEGASWTSIASNLPSSGSVYVIREHHRNPSLLFVGTEFGVFFTIDGGGAWIPLKMESSLPTVSVHDLIVHARDNDLIIGTHGRSIFILDDITPLEKGSGVFFAQNGAPEKDSRPLATIFPPRAALLYNQNDPLGGGPRGVGDQGDRFFAAPNRPFGVTISYFLKEEVERGREASLTVRDAAGQLVRELDLERKAGIQRTTWDLRLPPPYTVQARPDADTPGPFGGAPRGPLVLPGEYVVRLSIAGRDKSAPVTQEARVQVRQDPLATLSETDYRALHDDRVSATRLQARVQAAVRAAEQLAAQIDEARDALRTAGGPEAVTKEAGAIERELDAILDKVRGPRGRPGENEGPPRQPSIQQRVNRVAGEIGNVTSLPTRIQRDTLTNAATELEQELQRLNQLMSARIPALHKALDEAKVPWTIGRPVR